MSPGSSHHVPLADAQPVREHLLKLTQGGMKRVRIAQLAGVSRASIDGILGKRKQTPYNKVTDYMATALLSVVYEEPEPPPERPWYLLSWPEGVGTRRRLQAMAADGFSYQVIAHITGISTPGVFRHTVMCTDLVHVKTAAQVAKGYNWALSMSPEDFGVHSHQVKRLKGLAGHLGKGFAPRHCWDPDTIEDPAALPEWTGLCGTYQGAYLHRKHDIPICPPCGSAAHAHKNELKRARRASEG